MGPYLESSVRDPVRRPRENTKAFLKIPVSENVLSTTLPNEVIHFWIPILRSKTFNSRLQRKIQTVRSILFFDIEKKKILAFKGEEPVGSKIVMDGKIIEQVKSFEYLRMDVS